MKKKGGRVLFQRFRMLLLFVPVAQCIILCIAITAGNVSAANHALLVGIGTYPQLGPRASLEGPANDVQALQKLLLKRYQFAEQNLTVLVDGQADRTSILAAMDRLAERSEPNDFVLLYFSGHGTSAYDQDNGWAMSPYTGGLLPSNFSNKGDMQAMMSRMLVGTRDLRPRIEKIESACRVLVCIDACHAGYTVRSAYSDPNLQYRYVDLDGRIKQSGGPLPPMRSMLKPVYPYRNTFYLAASSPFEKAIDIGTWLIRKGRRTYDGKPHGAFTNALLHGLAGGADDNRDGNLTIGELYAQVRKEVTFSYPQTPQLLKPADAAIDSIVFSTSGTEVSFNPGVSGAEIHPIPAATQQSGERPGVGKDLIDAARGDFEGELNLEIDPAGAVLFEGQTLSIRVDSPVPVYLLILGVNVHGNIDLIYPWTRAEMKRINSPFQLQDIGEVSGPLFGREHLLAFGFRELPPFLADLVKRYGGEGGHEGALSVDDRLLSKVKEALQNGSVVGCSVLPVTTCRYEDIVKR